ncbi:reverse transcriptase RNA-dependent DNA polymerase [Nitzschia inconspicua]|uniref:Reverse transcriptase RNA-dependent DNA polymerase n=1 Tax=Nitzschia inconspicua TaxID=303405 RepID=A0A9K3KGW6_9STRA|nr:reverse transcriptase RNA-dependent DNA polymerase [Nitzschia inconspicua]
MKNRSQRSHTDAFRLAHQRLVRAGLKPRLQFLDNECSTLLKEFMHAEALDYQLVPPYLHRRNAAERAIRTFKNHFIAGLCSTDPAFPIHLWDRLLPHAELSLNLLRGSRLNPKLSAWAPHATDGWYIGPAMESYCCHTVWITDTRRERVTDTVSFFPQSVALPLASPDDLIRASLQDILAILRKPAARSTPLLSPSNRHALEQLADIFNCADEPHEPHPTPAPHDEDCPAPAAPLTPSSPSTPRHSNVRSLTPTPLRVPVTDCPALPDLPLPTSSAPATPLATAPAPLRVAVTNPDRPDAPTETFSSLTGPKARRQRRTQRHPKRTTAAPSPEPPVTPRHTGALPQPTYQAAHLATTSFEQLMLEAGVPATYHTALHGNAFNPDTGKIAEYAELSQCSDGAYWRASNAEEIGRLAQGYKHIKGTNTIYFIRKKQVPHHKKVTYLRIVCAHRPEKENPYRVRWTVGGNLIDYPHDASTKTADLLTVKLLINSVLSTIGAKFMTGDLKDFYLGTPMADYEYMRIHRRFIPDDIFILYNLADLLDGDYIYVEIRRGMYGLPQAGRIANDYLRTFLEPAGYHPTPNTPGLWRHKTRPIIFSLVVDDFGVKYVNQDDVDHLLGTLRQRYECKADWAGTRYCGLTLAWDYEARTCDISMPGYVERALTRFAHPNPPRPEYSPHTWIKPAYGAKVHFAPDVDTSPQLDAAGIKRVQEIVGVFLFYARAVDCTMLPALGSISTQQARATTKTLSAITKFLNYAATNPEAVVRYRSSGMQLHIESDASYLSEAKARSRYAGFHYLSEPSTNPTTHPAPNGAIHIPCQILKEVVSSAAEAELAGTFHNGKEACPIRVCLEELGHPQGPTPIVTDNSTAAGIANDTVKQKRSKAMDMRFYWIRDRVRQGQFHIIWRKGALNRADYFTKHHPAAHHRAIRSAYLHEPKSASTNYFQCLADDDSPNPVAQTAPKATSTDEGVCASLRHINPSSVSMGEGVLIPVRNPDITDRYKPASSAVTAGTANRHSSATRQTRRRASKRSHRQTSS